MKIAVSSGIWKSHVLALLNDRWCYEVTAAGCQAVISPGFTFLGISCYVLCFSPYCPLTTINSKDFGEDMEWSQWRLIPLNAILLDAMVRYNGPHSSLRTMALLRTTHLTFMLISQEQSKFGLYGCTYICTYSSHEIGSLTIQILHFHILGDGWWWWKRSISKWL